MQSKLFLLLFFLCIISLTFSSNNQKRKRQTENNILNPQDENTQGNYSQITYQTVPPSANNLQIDNIIFYDLLKPQNVEIFTIPSNLLNKILKIEKNIFRYIFAYLSFFEIEFNFKYISTTFYKLYVKFLQEEKLLLKEHLTNKTKFLENINCERVYFDFFETRHWIKPSRIEYVNVDCFCEHLILFPKSIRQIIWFTFEEIEYKYVLFKNGHLSILKKVTDKKGYFVFTSVDNHDFQNFESYINGYNYKKEPLKIYSFQENVRFIEFQTHSASPLIFIIHKTGNLSQSIWHIQGLKKIYIFKPGREFSLKCYLKNISGYLVKQIDNFVSLFEFKKQNNGIYTKIITHGFKTNVKEIKSKDFEHYAADVPFIFKL